MDRERDLRGAGRPRLRSGIAAGLAAGVCIAAGVVAPMRASASTTETFYFHGQANQDDANRTASLAGSGSPTATFNTVKPTGTTDVTQTGDDPEANETVGNNPFMPFWTAGVKGTFSGVLHFDWWWTADNAAAAGGTADQVDVGVFADGALISRDSSGQPAVVTVKVLPGQPGSPRESTADVAVSGTALSSLEIQVRGTAATGVSETVHYDTASMPSSFQASFTALPPSPAPAPQPCTSALCFSQPLALPKSSDTGDTTKTCYNPCGEPSLAVSPADGTLYVSTPRTILVCCNSQASPVWKSTDNGTTWSDPIFPTGAENATTGGDTELAVDKRGTVYEGELWLGSDSIYSSSDKGATWNWSPASHDLAADREWFTYAPGEDALYGWYDGFKGLMVVKAPLNTPLGSSTSEFFPVERVAVPECAASQATNCPDLPANSVAGTPIIDGTVSPGRPSVGPDGTVYLPFPYQVKDQGIGIAETTDGLNFTYAYVKGAGGGSLGDTGNDFPVSALDSAGRLYIAWVEDKGDGFNLYLASSGDKGATWTAPLEVSRGISKTAVFPNVVAGAAGEVAVSWYGTDVAGDNNTVPDSTSWNVYATEITAAASAAPALTTGIVQSDFHRGPICTMGTACTGTTRNLLDFFDMKFDRSGSLGVVYTRDFGNGKTEIAYSHQVSGCILTAADCGGPATNVAEFPLTTAAPTVGGGLLAAFFLIRRRRRTAPA